MTILFHLGHPAHFHLFKFSIRELKASGHHVLIAIKKKDVLEELLQDSGLDYVNILPEGKKQSKWDLIRSQWKQIRAIHRLVKKEKVDLLCGTSAAISLVGKWNGITSYNFNEDDAEVVPMYARLAYPWATLIFAPKCCSVGKWQQKKIAYPSYHELAYLHPDHFTPDSKIWEQYFAQNESVFLIRFAQLTAHHDSGIKGINLELALKIIEKLEQHGTICINSEKELPPELEKYQLHIKASEMHHIQANCRLFIGDSQTMSAECAVLGVPFIRINDFAGRLSYLEELENHFGLGKSFLPQEKEQILETLDHWLNAKNLHSQWQEKKVQMLTQRINLSDYITRQLLRAPKELLEESGKARQ
ncbi:MAG: DUF354 domain-containing protein [Bacteroidetes bacterium]|nr:MAG: DUF354 domain-containing protein [Bacteroidota bacterium]